MARNWQYPRWRRLLMQSSMWLILGGTVGLAALLDRHQHDELRVTLDNPLQCGSIRLQLPAHWMFEFTENGMVTATESNTYPPQRSLEVTVAPPAEPGLIDQLLQKRDAGTAQPVTFGPAGTSMGHLYSWAVSIEEDSEQGTLGQVIATGVLPSGPEVTLRLKHLAMPGESLDSDEDIDLVRRIAATVKIAPADEPPRQD
jgi:hypothetical protein